MPATGSCPRTATLSFRTRAGSCGLTGRTSILTDSPCEQTPGLQATTTPHPHPPPPPPPPQHSSAGAHLPWTFLRMRGSDVCFHLRAMDALPTRVCSFLRQYAPGVAAPHHAHLDTRTAARACRWLFIPFLRRTRYALPLHARRRYPHPARDALPRPFPAATPTKPSTGARTRHRYACLATTARCAPVSPALCGVERWADVSTPASSHPHRTAPAFSARCNLRGGHLSSSILRGGSW